MYQNPPPQCTLTMNALKAMWLLLKCKRLKSKRLSENCTAFRRQSDTTKVFFKKKNEKEKSASKAKPAITDTADCKVKGPSLFLQLSPVLIPNCFEVHLVVFIYTSM